LEATEDLLRKDVDYLLRRWRNVEASIANARPASAVYREEELHIKALRDLYTEDIGRIVIDDFDVYNDAKSFLETLVPGAGRKIELYREQTPIFDAFGIEVDIARALSRKVWLPSGGYLMIDQTEALTTFDVNTGKFVGKLSLRDTVLKTNLEAVNEIAAQLRLRNIGGIIILDFIDMDEAEDRDQVFEALEARLEKDKAKVNVLKISELGLVQMTRKRTSESLGRTLMEECAHCNGLGHVRSLRTVSLDLIRDIERFASQTGIKDLVITLRSSVKNILSKTDNEYFRRICDRYKLSITFKIQDFDEDDLRLPAYEILPSQAGQ
jgi:ribonuclease G